MDVKISGLYPNSFLVLTSTRVLNLKMLHCMLHLLDYLTLGMLYSVIVKEATVAVMFDSLGVW